MPPPFPQAVPTSALPHTESIPDGALVDISVPDGGGFVSYHTTFGELKSVLKSEFVTTAGSNVNIRQKETGEMQMFEATPVVGWRTFWLHNGGLQFGELEEE